MGARRNGTRRERGYQWFSPLAEDDWSDEKWLATNFDGRHPSALDGKVARCNTPCI
jgi:hypothetical protein